MSHFQSSYGLAEPSRGEIDASRGVTVLEFGASWCPICQEAQQDIADAIQERSDVQHIKIEDGAGKPLGRSYRIKLWPTLVVLKDGVEISRVVRPADIDIIREALSKLPQE